MSDNFRTHKFMCTQCRKYFPVTALDSQWTRYTETSDFVQDIFPDMHADKRELLISGVCGTCSDDSE